MILSEPFNSFHHFSSRVMYSAQKNKTVPCLIVACVLILASDGGLKVATAAIKVSTTVVCTVLIAVLISVLLTVVDGVCQQSTTKQTTTHTQGSGAAGSHTSSTRTTAWHGSSVPAAVWCSICTHGWAILLRIAAIALGWVPAILLLRRITAILLLRVATILLLLWLLLWISSLCRVPSAVLGPLV